MVDVITFLLPGLVQSLKLALIVLAVGLPLGLVLGIGLHTLSKSGRIALWALTELGRGFPALVTLYLVYFGLPSIGIVLSSFNAVVLAFGYTSACYTAEVFRSSLAAVPAAQFEATLAVGLTLPQSLRLVIVPQALKIAALPIIGFAIIIFQGTSLAYSIGESELSSMAYSRGTAEFDVMPYLAGASLLYLGVVLVMELAGRVAKAWIVGRAGKTQRTSGYPVTN